MIHGRGVRVSRHAPARLAAALRSPVGRDAWVADVLARERTVPAPVGDAGWLLRDLLALRLVARVDDRLEPRARLDLVGDLLVASDLRRHCRAPDFVVGPGPASFTLARHVRPHGRGRVLDLGCGSGIQGLLLGDRRTEVLALDINPRALVFARLNADLNGRPRLLARVGDFLGPAPDAGLDGRFATVVANPPFVLAPRHGLVYRDRPLPGDEVSARTIERVARALAPGGRGYVLCNWIDRGGDWQAPVRAWTASTGRDGAVTRLASLDVTAYAATWTRDLPPSARPAAIAAWTRALTAEGVAQVHVGIVSLSRPERASRSAPRFETVDHATA